MYSSKKWVNHGVASRHKQKRKRSKRRSVSVENKEMAKQISAERSRSQGTVVTTSGNPSLLQTFSNFAKNMDLVKIRNQITELNRIFEQVNGVIQQFNQMNRPPIPPNYQSNFMRHNNYRPYNQQQHAYQPTSHQMPPYHSNPHG